MFSLRFGIPPLHQLFFRGEVKIVTNLDMKEIDQARRARRARRAVTEIESVWS